LQPNAPNYNDTLMKIELQLAWTIIVVSSVISERNRRCSVGFGKF